MPTKTVPIILVDEKSAAVALGLTPRFLQARRQRGDGPPYVAISKRAVRYRLTDLENWAAARLRKSTSDTSAKQ